YRNHCVDGFNPGLQWLINRLTVDNSRSFPFDWHFKGLTFYRAFRVNRMAEGIANPANDAFSNLYGSNFSGTFNRIAFTKISGVTQQYCSNIVFFKAHCDTLKVLRKVDQFSLLNRGKTINTGNTVSYLKNGSHFFQFRSGFKSGKL